MEIISCKKKEYEVLSKLESTAQFDRFLVSRKDKKYVLTKYQLESLAISEFKRIKQIHRYFYYSPKPLVLSKSEKIIIKEYIEGENVLSLISKGDLCEEIYTQIYEMYRFCRTGKFELNYLPENYVFNGK